MKKTFISFISLYFLFTIINPAEFKAQAANYIDFLPLKVGNIWVYQCTTNGSFCGGCSGRTKVSLLRDTVMNGKTYYFCQITNVTLSGACFGCGGAVPFTNWIRVDSISANLFRYGPSCPWTPNEMMLDSFKSRLHDSISISCSRPSQWQRYVCTDTSSINIFGSNRQRRTYILTGFESGAKRVYVKGIGLDTAARSGLEGGTYVCTRREVLRGCVINGVVYGDTTIPVGIKKITSEIPEEFSLEQNYPNPFNPVTSIKFEIPKSKSETNSKTEVRIYDVLGEEISILVNEQLSPGTYEVEFDGTNYPSGVYYYALTVGDFNETRKMVLIK